MACMIYEINGGVVVGGHGNTQVTCHVGVPSCGQRHRNVFIVYLLPCTITYTIVKSPLPRLHAPRLGSFLHFPTTPVLSPAR